MSDTKPPVFIAPPEVQEEFKKREAKESPPKPIVKPAGATVKKVEEQPKDGGKAAPTDEGKGKEEGTEKKRVKFDRKPPTVRAQAHSVLDYTKFDSLADELSSDEEEVEVHQKDLNPEGLPEEWRDLPQDIQAELVRERMTSEGRGGEFYTESTLPENIRLQKEKTDKLMKDLKDGKSEKLPDELTPEMKHQLKFAMGTLPEDTKKDLLKRYPDLNKKSKGYDPKEVEFIEAVKDGDLEKVRGMLEGDKPVDVMARLNTQHHVGNGASALHIAAFHGHIKITALLIDNGADVNCADMYEKGVTPLYCAVEGPNASEEMIDLLVRHKAKHDIKVEKDGTTAFHRAVSLPKGLTSAKALLKHGADLHAVSNTMFTPLHVAALVGNLQSAEWLISVGAYVNGAAAGGITPLHLASGKRNIPMVQLLLTFGADPTCPTEKAKTPYDSVVDAMEEALKEKEEKPESHKPEVFAKEYQKAEELLKILRVGKPDSIPASAWDPVGMAMELRERGNKAFKAKNYQRALSEYGMALHFDRDQPLVFGNRAQVFLERKEYRMAILEAKASVSLKPESNVKGYFRLGQAFERIGDDQEAAMAYAMGLVMHTDPSTPSRDELVHGLKGCGMRMGWTYEEQDDGGLKPVATQDLKAGTQLLSIRPFATAPMIHDATNFRNSNRCPHCQKAQESSKPCWVRCKMGEPWACPFFYCSFKCYALHHRTHEFECRWSSFIRERSQQCGVEVQLGVLVLRVMTTHFLERTGRAPYRPVACTWPFLRRFFELNSQNRLDQVDESKMEKFSKFCTELRAVVPEPFLREFTDHDICNILNCATVLPLNTDRDPLDTTPVFSLAHPFWFQHECQANLVRHTDEDNRSTMCTLSGVGKGSGLTYSYLQGVQMQPKSWRLKMLATVNRISCSCDMCENPDYMLGLKCQACKGGYRTPVYSGDKPYPSYRPTRGCSECGHSFPALKCNFTTISVSKCTKCPTGGYVSQHPVEDLVAEEKEWLCQGCGSTDDGEVYEEKSAALLNKYEMFSLLGGAVKTEQDMAKYVQMVTDFQKEVEKEAHPTHFIVLNLLTRSLRLPCFDYAAMITVGKRAVDLASMIVTIPHLATAHAYMYLGKAYGQVMVQHGKRDDLEKGMDDALERSAKILTLLMGKNCNQVSEVGKFRHQVYKLIREKFGK